MNKSVENKIEKLIEEANEKVRESVAKVRGGDIISAIPGIGPAGSLIPMVGQMHAGYKAGRELGHPVAGTLLGQEGAAGALSKNDPSVDISDVYTKKNMIKRGLIALPSGAISGAILATALNGENTTPSDLATGALTGAAALGTSVPLIAPGLRYGLGKVFGESRK